MLCYKCNNQIPDYSLVCIKCGAELSVKARQRAGVQPDMGPIPNVITQSMKWFYFLIYFYLFAEAASFTINALSYIIGSFDIMTPTGETATIEIPCFAQLGSQYKFIDIIYSVLCLLMAGLAMLTRFRLSGFKKNGPVLLTVFLSVPTVINTIYVTALLIALKSFTFADCMTLVVQIGIQGALVFANCIYFSKRSDRFVN